MPEEEVESTPYLDSIRTSLVNGIVSSNINRASILYLLKRMPKNEMQAEKVAYKLGISHRTALYHLNILHDYGFVEVRKFRKRGDKILRSVWGLNLKNRDNVEKALMRIEKRFDPRELEKFISRNIVPR